ncbi:hypothetical protein [Bacillus manliponensis]|uniref:hypothetical protein n=1 Tax=Bacillus manliponensis TaxID=574376 RepID=UPI0035124F5D
MCSSGQILFLPRAMLQQMDEISTFVILIYVTATFVKWSSWIYISNLHVTILNNRPIISQLFPLPISLIMIIEMKLNVLFTM